MRSSLSAVLALALAAGCSKSAQSNTTEQQPAPQRCESLDMLATPFSNGPYGSNRGDVADDFTLTLADGSTWSARKHWTGCDVMVFIPDTIRVSQLDPTPVWEKDLDALLAASPANVHYFFVARTASATAEKNVAAMQERVETVLGDMATADANHWSKRVHVVAGTSTGYGNWVGEVLAKGAGMGGFAIDPHQRIRGVGALADVARYSSVLAAQNAWPWESNLAFAANEAKYLNQDAVRTARLAAQDAKVVTLWSGEVLQQFAETDVELPSAGELARYDTLEVEVTQACPRADAPELGYVDESGKGQDNCGAWDYIASLTVAQGDAQVEMARFITSYHRETHWVVDATPALGLLKEGGVRHFRWDFAPEWNKQPTATRLSLRFTNQGKGGVPAQTTLLWRYPGRHFDTTYNEGVAPAQVSIPADAKRVEFFAIITGHGNDSVSCAEFCNHQHEITVNGTKSLREYPMAQQSDGCISELENGMTPNQAGTWWFGRGGWCPGEQVNPWVVDVTSLATPGSTMTVAYRGLFDGEPPTNTDAADKVGNIDFTAYVVVYR